MDTSKSRKPIENEANLGSIRVPRATLERIKDERERLRHSGAGEPSYARIVTRAWEIYEAILRISIELHVSPEHVVRRMGKLMIEQKSQFSDKKVVNFPTDTDMLDKPDQDLLNAFSEVFQRGDAALKARLHVSISVFQELLRAHRHQPDTQQEKDNPAQPKQGSGGSG